jgi:hypothetical protein
MPAIIIPQGDTYPPTSPEMTEDEYFLRGPYLARSEAGIVLLRVPSPYYNEEATKTWHHYLMQWDPQHREWFRVAQIQIEMLEIAIRNYEQLFPEYAQERPTSLPAAIVGRVDFIVGNPKKIVVCEWRRGWSAEDPLAVRTEHDRDAFDLDWALDWCREMGAKIINSHDGDYIRAFFDGQRAIRTRGQIMAHRRRSSLAQADFAYQ